MILMKPIITEQSMKNAGNSVYTFLVDRDANKPEIAKAVAEQFKVDVLRVRTINMKGEVKQQRKVRRSYRTLSYKKAMVSIKKGQIIAIFETPKEEATVTIGNEPEIKEKRNLLRGTKVKIEKSQVEVAPLTQRKIIAGKGGGKG